MTIEERADVSVELDAVRLRMTTSRRPERLRPIGMQSITLDDDALDTLPELVRSLSRPGPVLVLADPVPMRRGPLDLKAHVLTLLAPLGARLVTIGTPGVELHADMAAVDSATESVRGAGCVVAVGSGTICDIGKKATEGETSIPYVVVQTACSVNAFSDDMAVLLLRGAKRTVPSRWPDALVMDLPTIAESPTRLNQAGVGELMSMFTAPADWRLAGMVGLDPGYDEQVVGLFRDGGEELERVAAGVRTGDRASLRWLCARMTLSGLALGIAGRTAPISGSEHAVSHLIDMAAARTGDRTGLHGAQVGVASVVSAALWEDVLERFDPAQAMAAPPSPEAARARIERSFARFDPSGEMADECWRLYRHKLEAWTVSEEARRAFAADWPQHRVELARNLLSPERIVAALRAAGAPTRFSELEPAAGPDVARWAVSAAHLLRDRFGVMDLVDLTGCWTDEDVDRVLDRAAAAGGGR